MTLSDIFFVILYGAAFILVVYFIVGLFHKPAGPSTVIVYNDETPVYQESVIWPWYSPYNWYNTWPPWSYTGGGYYGRGSGHRYHGPRWGAVGRPYGGAGRSAHSGAPRVSRARGGDRR